MTVWTGLTWDHPRGYQALRAATAHPDAPACDIRWDIQPLEGFESAPIAETARHYDLVVLDHPHIGEAIETGALQPLDDIFTAAELATWRAETVGPSLRSYEMAGRLWAVPLDAATQVSVRGDTGIPVPQTWAQAVELSGEVAAAVPTSGPHLFLTLCGIAVADGASPGDDDIFLGEAEFGAAVEMLRHFVPDRPGDGNDNPIALLERMSAADGPQYCPHVYGYVNYTRRPRPLLFGDAPRGRAGRRGSVLGGTGIAFSGRGTPDAALLDHVRWLMSAAAQRRFVTAEEGQPGVRSAWEDDTVNAASHDFYRATRATIEDAWIRPRHAGAIAFQNAGAAAVRACLFDHHDIRRLTREVNESFEISLRPATTARTIS
ncbi:extracellular solute-binding protein [Nocardia sp. NBC_01329]|uniref:extracellular solute-binding protein n=1 Tax=Nocardia sp. NBC_01329 TaxID=2903594 RepID=UPI002E14DAC1|nr:extracellular solute-binding protein [Nocardia sp. NBC_01329]